MGESHTGPYLLERIMSRRMVTVEITASLASAVGAMSTHQVSALVVVDGRGDPVGLLSQTDIARHLTRGLAANRAPTRPHLVSDVMSPSLLTLPPSCPVGAAARLLSSCRIHRVLVKQGNQYVGIVSMTDIARLVGEVGFDGDPATAAWEVSFDVSTPRDVFGASFARCEADPEFGRKFYDRFLATSADVRGRFANTAMAHQQRVIVGALKRAGDIALGKPEALAELAELARSHNRSHHDIHPELYALWLESLLATVREVDPAYDLVVEQSWRILMGNVISYMTRRY